MHTATPTPRHGYKTVTLSSLDLARLLDWCDQSTVRTQSGKHIPITAMSWYSDAYRSASADFFRQIETSSRRNLREVRHG